VTGWGVFRREFWVADEDIDRRQARSDDDIVMPFRRDGELVAGFAAVPGVVAVVLLIVAVVIR